ncbi:copper amine oxidase domain protein [Desulfofarcimen acetoxidans DSM 771]|uniref:Copper amine oxidase domain protein n=1 Tax=Desulfofarcimen acetoxidans (strain ATCC 49208 / DSM 771 / KCTC 5769 / VKM B-1644 / 5575) TaxID=485916 RepID=C8W0Y8_DESAS|nr:copper amine oxidase N-terminal domain-containing protein [Desulfofarcimen acetoxidans]ACV63384.1 copper amine oxidase domain protein [Desulfofarcimen acetoxidans DSM 771]
MKKPILIFVLLIACFFSTLAPLMAGTTARLIVNGQVIEGSFIAQNDSLLVPLRSVMETLGALVLYNDQEKLIMAKKADTVIALQIGNKLAAVNNKQVTLDQAPFFYQGQVLVPLSFLAGALNTQVNWDKQASTAYVNAAIEDKLCQPVDEKNKQLLYNRLAELENRYFEIRSGQGYSDREEIASLLTEVFADREVARAYADEKQLFAESYNSSDIYQGVSNDWVGINCVTMFTPSSEILVLQSAPDTFELLAICHLDLDSLFGITKTTLIKKGDSFRLLREDFYAAADIVCRQALPAQ